MIRSRLDPEVDGEPLEYQGRFIEEVRILEMKTRLFLAEYFTGLSASLGPTSGRLVVLHDTLLRYTNLGRLSGVIRSIIRDQEAADHIIESWLWLPRDMQQLADTRNALAHMPGPWTEKPAHHRNDSVRLLGKVYSGTVGLWQTLCLADGKVLTACNEDHHAEHGDRLTELLPN